MIIVEYTKPIKVTVGMAEERAIPHAWVLAQNYPNPFNPTTVVSYQVPVVSHVDLRVFDLLGREVAVLVNESKTPGSYAVTFNASGLASGVYLYRISVVPLARRDFVPTGDGQAGNPSASSGQGFVQTKKLVLVR